MMACVADKIVCSPWAAVGSIGVLNGMPNVAERMEKEGTIAGCPPVTTAKWNHTIFHPQ